MKRSALSLSLEGPSSKTPGKHRIKIVYSLIKLRIAEERLIWPERFSLPGLFQTETFNLRARVLCRRAGRRVGRSSTLLFKILIWSWSWNEFSLSLSSSLKIQEKSENFKHSYNLLSVQTAKRRQMNESSLTALDGEPGERLPVRDVWSGKRYWNEI